MTMYAEERQQAIARLVTQRGRMSVNQLAREYDVTTETVRRDLSTLERLGLVRRVHGGVVPPSRSPSSSRASASATRSTPRPRTASRGPRSTGSRPPGGTDPPRRGVDDRAARDPPPPGPRFTVVTHAVPIAARLAGQPHLDLRLLPGRVRPTTQAAVGPETVGRSPTCASTSRSSAPTASPPTTGSPHPTPTRPLSNERSSGAATWSWLSPMPRSSASRPPYGSRPPARRRRDHRRRRAVGDTPSPHRQASRSSFA